MTTRFVVCVSFQGVLEEAHVFDTENQASKKFDSLVREFLIVCECLSDSDSIESVFGDVSQASRFLSDNTDFHVSMLEAKA